MDSPISWLAARTPPAPTELTNWFGIPSEVSESEHGVASVSRVLLNAALEHLEDVMSRPGRDRGAAYRLLAADALITYCCEFASESSDIESALLEVFSAARSGVALE